MLHRIRDLQAFSIHAVEGDVGSVDDFYFDDQVWTVRYIVADVGSWLEKRKVLVSPFSIQIVAADLRRLMTSETKEKIRNSPDWESEKPISKQYEARFSNYYRYPYYWGGPYLWGQAPYPAGISLAQESPLDPQEQGPTKEEIEQSHLRSVREVTGYHLATSDGDIGYVEDLLLDPVTWRIHYLVINTGKWLPGRSVLISPNWIEKIDWTKSQVCIDQTREAVKNAPPFDGPEHLTRDYETRLFAYYDRPGYWENTSPRH